MAVWMVVLGGLLLAVVSYDALSTTLAMNAPAGPVTAMIARRCWSLARRLSPGPRSTIMGLAGPAILVITVAVWLLLLWGGWTLIFAADPEAVVSSSTGQPADGWARVYFAGFTTFTLGVGDYVPNGPPWQVLTTVAVVSGLALTTTAITYLVPVVTAVTVRRTQANTIAALGATPQDIVLATWRRGSFGYLDDQLPRLAESILLTAERHLSYPILHFFHSTQRDQDFRVQLFNLDEAVTILQHGVPEHVRPHPAALDSVRHATRQVMQRVAVDPSPGDEPAPPGLEPLRRAGIPTLGDDLFRRAVGELLEHRRNLTSYAEESLWFASAVAQDPARP